MNPTLILYGTLGCHLCELAEDYVLPAVQAHQLTLILIDIAEHDGMQAYEARIPVVAYGEHELDWPFDTAAVASFILRQKE